MSDYDEDDDEIDISGSGDLEVINRAIKFLNKAMDADSENRANAVTWSKFRSGEQWPQKDITSRELQGRPYLTINKTDAFCTQVGNQQRQQRPRIKVDPTNTLATKQTADIIQGMVRHIESTKGGGDLAYDTAFDSAITTGVGYWRILSEYVADDSFDQQLYLAQIDNPLSCFRDPNSTMPDGSDMEEFLIIDTISHEEYRRMSPDADLASWTAGTQSDWLTKDSIRVAEYFCVNQKREKLYALSNGQTSWADKLPSKQELKANGIKIVDERSSYRKFINWYKLSALEVLQKAILPGRWIPVVPVYGKVEIIDGKRKLSGIVKNAMEPAQMYNFWRTAQTEVAALAPKAKWLIAEGQDEGHENEWATANVSARATLRYKQTDVSGQPAPMPQRIQPDAAPSGIIELANAIGNDLTSVLGIVDPAMRIGGNVSGKALNAERQQSDNASFLYYDNMTRSIAQTGRILLDAIPYYYSAERIVRIIGDDGRASLEIINKMEGDKVHNDVTIGQYDVVMDTGPGYNTKRQEAVDAMMPLLSHNEDLMKVAGDLVFRNMDFPGADTIADRLAAANPLAQIDDKSEVPVAVQMQMKQMQAQLQQLQQQLQAAQGVIKTRADLKQMEEDAETKRVLMRETSMVHRNEQDNAAWMHDIQTKSITSMNVSELKGVVELLKNRLDREAMNFHKMADREQAAAERKEDIESAQIQNSGDPDGLAQLMQIAQYNPSQPTPQQPQPQPGMPGP